MSSRNCVRLPEACQWVMSGKVHEFSVMAPPAAERANHSQQQPESKQ